ncbi:hypothetical protein RIF29_39032 [Crotalaria pallida]|uniref:Reverse transcriptase zinc-binding domain-containing protein n=1 Tax=Crotalaria pallida TaxID=3830 RepID=A0AAN9E0G9_CROPI
MWTDAGWNWDWVWTLLSGDIKEESENIHILGFSDLHDDEVSWSWVWRIKCHEKIKFLIWLVLHNAIPTNDFRFRRGMASSPNCARCGAGSESVLHCLRDYSPSTELWLRFGFGNQDLMCMDVWSWIRNMVDSDRCHKFLAILWWVWRWRNMEVLGTERWGLDQVSYFIQSTLDDLVQYYAPRIATHSGRLIAGGQQLVKFDCAPDPLVPLLNDDALGRVYLRP